MEYKNSNTSGLRRGGKVHNYEMSVINEDVHKFVDAKQFPVTPNNSNTTMIESSLLYLSTPRTIKKAKAAGKDAEKVIRRRDSSILLPCGKHFQVPILPAFYPIDIRNSLKIPYTNSDNNTTQYPLVAETTLKRMFNFLRINSISYSYCCDAKGGNSNANGENIFEKGNNGHGRFDCFFASGISIIKFSIQFWKLEMKPREKRNSSLIFLPRFGREERRDDIEEYWNKNAALIVEVQRYRGSTIEMHNIRKCLFRALLQKSDGIFDYINNDNDNWESNESGKQHNNVLQSIFKKVKVKSGGKSISRLNHLHQAKVKHSKKKQEYGLGRGQVQMDDIVENQDHSENGDDDEMVYTPYDTMKTFLRLLESHRFDENRSGMERLVLSTNSTSSKYATIISRALLLEGENPLGIRLQHCLLRYIMENCSSLCCCYEHHEQHCGSQRCAVCEEEELLEGRDYSHGTCAVNDNSHAWEMQVLALRVLSNALEQIVSSSRKLTVDEHHYDSNSSPFSLSGALWTGTNVANIFLSNMKMASHQPEKAALSAKCLFYLLTAGDGPADANNHTNLSNLGINKKDIVAAYQYGKDHHLSLEMECARLIEHCL